MYPIGSVRSLIRPAWTRPQTLVAALHGYLKISVLPALPVESLDTGEFFQIIMAPIAAKFEPVHTTHSRQSGKTPPMTTAHFSLIALTPVAYLAGSIPFGLMVGLAKGVDPRKAGSGNIGATNVGRLLGGKFFALVFALDLLKGLLPTLAAGAILHFAAGTAASYAQWLLVGFATILGHMFSLFLNFKGGKGVATSMGVILGVYPYYTLAAGATLFVFLIVFALSRYISVASMMAAIGFVVAYVTIGILRHWPIFRQQLPLLAFAVVVSALIIYKHRGNLARLRGD